MGCVKMGLKIDPFFLNCIHLVPGFNCVLEFSLPENNHVGDVGCLDLGVRGSSQFPYSRRSLTWLNIVSIGVCGLY